MDITINSPIVKEEARKIIEPELLPGFDSLPSFSIPTIDYEKLINTIKLKVAVARCARLSYLTFDRKIDYAKDIALADMLFKNKHASPFEHVCRCMSNEEYKSFIKGRVKLGLDGSTGGWGGPPQETYHPTAELMGWCNNLKGFIQYRYLIENQS